MTEISKDNVRKAQIFMRDEWRDIPPLGIKQGMVFRLFEPDGTPVSDGTQTDFVATKDSYLNRDGSVTIERVCLLDGCGGRKNENKK
jgi:hypothetical protein